MPNLLPRDNDGDPIPAMRLRPGGGHVIAASGVSARNVSAFDVDTRIVSVVASVPVWLAFGNDTVTAAAGGHYFPAGVYYDFAVGGAKDGVHHTHLAVLAAGADGTVYVSEKE